jgi:hypothetical protein
MVDLEEINHLLARVECIRQFRLSLSPDPYMPDPVYHYDLELELFNPDSSANVELIFRDVGELKVPKFGGLSQVTMLMVEKNHPGHERTLRVRQLEDDWLSFTCRGVEIVSQHF